MSLNQKLTSYDEGAIETKNDMEWLRLRPENHIRTVDAQGQLHVIKEILDNALDETEIRPNGKVDILLFLDRRKHKWQIAIADNGRGFPFSAFVPAFTVLKTSGKFNRDSYVTSSGLNGFGSKVANALSENLRAITWRDGKIATLHTHHSDVVNHHTENYSNRYGNTGTVVIYEPLDEYFDGVDEFVNDAHSQLFDTARLLGMFASNSTITIKVVSKSLDSDVWAIGAEETLSLLFDKYWNDPATVTVVDGTDHNASLDFLRTLWKVDSSFIWSEHFTSKDIPELENTVMKVQMEGKRSVEKPVLLMFDLTMYLPKIMRGTCVTAVVNNIPLKDNSSSTHIAAVAAMKTILAPFVDNEDYRKFFISEYRLPLCFAMGIKFAEARFDSLAKDAIFNLPFERRLQNMFETCFRMFSDDYWKELYEKISDHLVVQYHAYYNKPITSAKSSKKLSLTLVDQKFLDCSIRDPEKSELFIVEGVSAQHISEGRDSRYQAAMMIRGKPLNVMKTGGKGSTPVSNLNNYTPYQDLQKILNVHPSQTDLSTLQYNKIILLQDADVDGGHISTLHIGALANIHKDLLPAGKVYLANPPLYEVIVGDKKKYIRTKEDLIYFRIIQLYMPVLDIHVQDKNKTIFVEPKQLLDDEYIEFCTLVNLVGDIYDDLSKELVIPRLVLEYIAMNTHRLQGNLTDRDIRDVFGHSSSYDVRSDIITIEFERKDIRFSLTDVCDALYEELLPLLRKISYFDMQIFATTNYTSHWQQTKVSLVTLYETFLQLNSKLTIKRHKGVGGMDPSDLEKTCVDPSTRFLHQITSVGDMERICRILGDDSSVRKQMLIDRGLL